jgi:hypothetical protein
MEGRIRNNTKLVSVQLIARIGRGDCLSGYSELESIWEVAKLVENGSGCVVGVARDATAGVVLSLSSPPPTPGMTFEDKKKKAFVGSAVRYGDNFPNIIQ